MTTNTGKRLLFAGYQSGEVDVWDLTTGKPQPMRDTRADRVGNIGPGSLSASYDGRWLATSGADRFVPVYDVQSRTSRLSLETESTDTITVAFSPDGRRLAALGADNRLYVWEFADGTASRFLTIGAIPRRAAVGTAPQRDERASWLAWMADDSLAVVSGGADVTVIQLDPAKWRRRIDGLVQKQFERMTRGRGCCIGINLRLRLSVPPGRFACDRQSGWPQLPDPVRLERTAVRRRARSGTGRRVLQFHDCGPLPTENGAWRSKTQQMFDPVEKTLVRRLYTVWDPEPSRDLDFAWVPDTFADDREGVINGQGRLIWRLKGSPPTTRIRSSPSSMAPSRMVARMGAGGTSSGAGSPTRANG